MKTLVKAEMAVPALDVKHHIRLNQLLWYGVIVIVVIVIVVVIIFVIFIESSSLPPPAMILPPGFLDPLLVFSVRSPPSPSTSSGKLMLRLRAQTGPHMQ